MAGGSSRVGPKCAEEHSTPTCQPGTVPLPQDGLRAARSHLGVWGQVRRGFPRRGYADVSRGPRAAAEEAARPSRTGTTAPPAIAVGGKTCSPRQRPLGGTWVKVDGLVTACFLVDF